ncbi:hypothetical protein [Peribacillus acanthi]|uniref:hypothetical protein n=1 Tax=Peribacillus acanthi TaxID=2171554 RepID=UPI000D3E113B|nr:hypothetical protein [Peribacillus acanthi]
MKLIVALIVIGIIFKLFKNYNRAREQRELLGLFEKVTQKHTVEEFDEIVNWELKLRSQLAELIMLKKSGRITEDKYIESLDYINKLHTVIEAKYNITAEEMAEYYLQATRSS